MRTKGTEMESTRRNRGEKDKNQPFPLHISFSLSGACPLPNCLTLTHMASPPCPEISLIVAFIVAFQMIDCSCQEQNVKIHEIRIHSINNLGRVLIPPSPLFSPLPSLHPHSSVYVCARETNELQRQQ